MPPPTNVATERAKVATQGWGARLLALQPADGKWGGGAYFPEWTSTTPTLQLLRQFGLDPTSDAARRALDHLRDAGVALDERTAEAVGIVESKRDGDGRWPLEHAHHNELLVDLGEAEGRPSRWITLHALRVLRWAD